MDEVDTAVIHEHHGPSWPGSHGLAIAPFSGGEPTCGLLYGLEIPSFSLTSSKALS
jgi:hypothetical protein